MGSGFGLERCRGPKKVVEGRFFLKCFQNLWAFCGVGGFFADPLCLSKIDPSVLGGILGGENHRVPA